MAEDKPKLDFEKLSVEEILELEDWEIGRFLLWIMGSMLQCKRTISDLAPAYAQYKHAVDEHRRLADLKSACQTMLRAHRDV